MPDAHQAPLVEETLMVPLVPDIDVVGIVSLGDDGSGKFWNLSTYVVGKNGASPITRSTLFIGRRSSLVTSIFTLKLTELPMTPEGWEGVNVKSTAFTIGVGDANHNKVPTVTTRVSASATLARLL